MHGKQQVGFTKLQPDLAIIHLLLMLQQNIPVDTKTYLRLTGKSCLLKQA